MSSSSSPGRVSSGRLLSVDVVAALDGTSPAQAHARRLGVPSPRQKDTNEGGQSSPGGGSGGSGGGTSPQGGDGVLSQDRLAASRALAIGADVSPILGPLNRPALIRLGSGARSSYGTGAKSLERASSNSGVAAPSPSPFYDQSPAARSFSTGSVNHRGSASSVGVGTVLEEMSNHNGGGDGSGAVSTPSHNGSAAAGASGSAGWEHGLRGSGNFESTFRQISAQNELLQQQKERKRQKLLRTSSQSSLLGNFAAREAATPEGSPIVPTLMQESAYSSSGSGSGGIGLGRVDLRRMRSANDVLTISLTRPEPPTQPAPFAIAAAAGTRSPPVTAGGTPTTAKTSEHQLPLRESSREQERAARAAAAARYRAERERAETEDAAGADQAAAAATAASIGGAPDAGTDSDTSSASPPPPSHGQAGAYSLPLEAELATVPCPSGQSIRPPLPRSNTEPVRNAFRIDSETGGTPPSLPSPTSAGSVPSSLSSSGGSGPAALRMPQSEASIVGLQASLQAEHAARQQAQLAAQLNRENMALEAAAAMASGTRAPTPTSSSQQQRGQTGAPGTSASAAPTAPTSAATTPRGNASAALDSLPAALYSAFPAPGGSVEPGAEHDSSGLGWGASAGDAFGGDDDEQKGDRESASLPSPAGASAALGSRGRPGPDVADMRLGAPATSRSAIPLNLGLRTNSSSATSGAQGQGQGQGGAVQRGDSRSRNMNLSLASLPPLPLTPASSTPSSRQHSPTRGGSSGGAGAGAGGTTRPQHLSTHSQSLSTGGLTPCSPPYLDNQQSYNSRNYATALASAVAAGGSSANGGRTSRHHSRTPSPSPAPPARKRVVFAAELVQEESYHARSRSVTPQPLHPSHQNGHGHRRRKSILRLPSAQHASANMRHVVSQILPHGSGVSPAGGGGGGSSSAFGYGGSGGGSTPIALFSSHAPFVSPLSLLRFQVALFHDSVNLAAYCTTVTRTGSVLIKYNSAGKPMNRWFYVQETTDDVRLCWCAPKYSRTKPLHEVNPNGLGFHAPTAASATAGVHGGGASGASGSGGHSQSSHGSESHVGHPSSLLPSFSIGRWKFNVDRSRSLLEMCGIHYGPYYSAKFCRYLDKADNASGKPWLCMSVQFKDGVIDLVCKDEHEVTAWFLGLQAQAPQTVYFMNRGMILWQRLIMKLNYYSLDQIKRVFAKREAAALAAKQARAAQGPADKAT